MPRISGRSTENYSNVLYSIDVMGSVPVDAFDNVQWTSLDPCILFPDPFYLIFFQLVLGLFSLIIGILLAGELMKRNKGALKTNTQIFLKCPLS